MINYKINNKRKAEIRVELMEAIKNRRSIRKFKSDPVPDEVLQILMEAVRWAPSWHNTQCWEMILVKDQKAKFEVLKTVPKTNPAHSAMVEAPLILVLCGKKGISGLYKGQAVTVKGDWLMFDTGIAMQTLCLAAYSLGLGTVIVGMFDHKEAEEILGVPQDVEVVAMTPLGYPADEGRTPKRRDVAEFVFSDHYGQKG
jgi:nitroreductase